MTMREIDGVRPEIHPSVWVAETAEVIGRVALAEDASVWYGAIVRADNDRIAVGRRSNVQDGAVLHTDRGIALTIGDEVTVGHQAMLHGCTIGDGTLVGIQAVVLNGARIGRESLVGAKALVTEGQSFPDRALIVGTPAKMVRQLDDAEVARLRSAAATYVAQAARHRASRRVDAAAPATSTSPGAAPDRAAPAAAVDASAVASAAGGGRP